MFLFPPRTAILELQPRYTQPGLCSLRHFGRGLLRPSARAVGRPCLAVAPAASQGAVSFPVTCSSRCFLQFLAPVLSVPPTVTSKRPCTRQLFTDYLHVADSPLSALLLLQLPLASARRACAFYSLRLYLQFYLFISFDWIAGNLLKSILMLNNSLFMYVCYLTHSLIF